MLVNIQSFITHTMFFSSYSSLHSINWMKANDTRTQEQQQNINCVVIWPMVCVYARKFCALNHPYFCAYDIGIFRLLLKIPRNFKRWSNFFHITWCLHSHKKRNGMLTPFWKVNEKQITSTLLAIGFFVVFSLVFRSVLSLVDFLFFFFFVVVVYLSLCVVCGKSANHFSIGQIYTQFSVFTHTDQFGLFHSSKCCEFLFFPLGILIRWF